jgi:hypothetical protein
MIELQKRGMISSSPPLRELKSKGVEVVAGGEVKDHTDSTHPASGAANTRIKVTGNKFQPLMGCSGSDIDNGD